MLAEIYKAICSKVLAIESNKTINLCCVCLQNFDEVMCSIHDKTEITLSSGIVVIEELTHILNAVLGISFVDISCLFNTICHKCKDTAVTSYNFKLCAKESANILHQATEHLEICFKGTPGSVLKKCKTMYVEIDVNAEADYVIKRYYDRKHYDNQRKALDRINTITQHQKPKTNVFNFQGDDDPSQDIESDPLATVSDEPQNSLLKREVAKENEKRLCFQAFKCPGCNTGFDSQELLQNHNREKKCLQVLQCDHCYYNTVDKGSLIAHIQYVHFHNRIVCDLCGKTFSTNSTLKRHKLRRHATKNCSTEMKTSFRAKRCLPCDQCDYITSSEFFLKQHIQFIHKDIVPVECNICKKSFPSEAILEIHKVVHTEPDVSRNHLKNQETYQCSECGKTLKKQCFKVHMESHKDERKYPCHICGKRFKHYANRYGHIRYVHMKIIKKREYDEKKIALARLEMMAQQPAAATTISVDALALTNLGSDFVKNKLERLSKEARPSSHSSKGFKFFNCPDCKAGFNTPELYEKHRALKKSCTKRKRGTYLCHLCDHSSPYQHLLRYHIEEIHERKGLICEDCGKCFHHRRKARFMAHLATHRNEKTFQCHECGRKLKSAESLKYHRSLHSGELNYPCHFCGARFRTPNVRNGHMKRYHQPKEMQ